MNLDTDMCVTRALETVWGQRQELLRRYGFGKIHLRAQITPRVWGGLCELNPPGMRFDTLYGMPVDVISNMPKATARVVLALDDAPNEAAL